MSFKELSAQGVEYLQQLEEERKQFILANNAFQAEAHKRMLEVLFPSQSESPENEKHDDPK